jgi:hypothetical protein
MLLRPNGEAQWLIPGMCEQIVEIQIRKLIMSQFARYGCLLIRRCSR